jgi:hypothetical protein
MSQSGETINGRPQYLEGTTGITGEPIIRQSLTEFFVCDVMAPVM